MAPTPSGDRWARLEDLFLQAADLPPADRPAFLDLHCANDPALRSEIEALLAQDDPHFATQVHGLVASGAHAVAADAHTGRRIGPYRILRQLGAGGMGAVYQAVRDDGAYTKEVAVKVLHLGLDSAPARDRFRQERQILAGLEHPGIARLIDGGETDTGVPYLVLEFVDGHDLLAYARDRRLSIPDRLRLFLDVCAAVQYAHQSLTVHRDLKPANILVTADGQIKLLDFGIAKLLDADAGRTATALVALTPQYASPEQVRGEPITTATDVYSLGVVLYELLTGRAPYQIKTMSPIDIDRAVCQTDAPPANLSGDLDNILAMAMRKDPRRRYLSVGEFADDLRRTLDNLPVRARPDTVLYRAGKFVRRNRLSVAAAAIAVAGLAAGLIVAVREARVARQQAAIAGRRFAEVRKLARSFLFDFDKEIANVAGTTKARELLVSTALEYLGRLSAEAHGDPDLLAEVAEAYKKVGDVQGNPAIASLGRTRDAIESYRRSCDLWDQLHRLRPADPIPLGKLAGTWLEIATVQRTLGLRDDSAESTRRGVEAAERGLAIAPRDPDLLGVVAAAAYRRGEALRIANKFAEAEAEFLRAADLYRKVQAVQPLPRNENAVAVVEGRLAIICVAQGRPEQAVAHAQIAVEIRRRLAAANPAQAQHRRGLATALEQLGDAFGISDGVSMGDPARAEPYLREALALTEQLVAADPNNRTSRDDLLQARIHLANILAGRKPEESVALARKAIADMDRAGWDRNRADLAYNLALAYIEITRASLQLGRAADASAALDRAAGLSETAVSGALQPLLRARILLAQRRRDEARRILETGLNPYRDRPLAQLDLPDLRDLASFYGLLGDCASLARERDVWTEWRRRKAVAVYPDSRLPALAAQAAASGCPKL